MEAYTNVLQKAIQQVEGVQEDIGLDSLTTRGAVSLFSKAVNNEETLELISYLIIKE